LLLAGEYVFRHVGRWLVVEDTLEKSGAIVVLSGSSPYRALEAAAIYGQNMAPQIWLTQPVSPVEEYREMGIEFRGEEYYNRAVLEHEGVPGGSVRTLEPIIENTEEEVQAIVAEMHRASITRVIIVTSPSHTRRVKALWRRLAPRDFEVIVRPAPQVPWDAGHWWRTTRDSLAVARELLGLANVWAGLPVRPAPH